jgi:hypothetical protein
MPESREQLEKRLREEAAAADVERTRADQESKERIEREIQRRLAEEK